MSELWSAAQLAVFARVIELNGFSAAARAYRVPKVAISRAIADLEKSMGVQLMKRTTRRIFLTAAGDAVLPHARAIGVEVEKVRQLAQTFSTSREGPLRVIADPTYGRVLLAPLVPRFLDSFPDIALDVVLDSGEGVDWDVAAGRAAGGTVRHARLPTEASGARSPRRFARSRAADSGQRRGRVPLPDDQGFGARRSARPSQTRGR